MNSETYYLRKWRQMSIRVLALLVIAANLIIWAIVAGMKGHPYVAIWLCIAEIAVVFVIVIQFHELERYHTLYVRSLSGSLIDHDHTNQ